MAAAAYGAIVSLMHVLDNLRHPSRQHLHYDRNQIETLSQNLSFLLGFLEDYSQILCHTETEDLARQIAYAVDEAEEIIDYHVVNQISQGSAYEVDIGLSSFREDLDRVLNKIESIKKELMMGKGQERAVKQQHPRVSRPAAGSSAPSSSGKINTMVGFDDHLVHILDQLTGHGSDLQIVSITGMGGIGKTTLAQHVFDNRCIVESFDLRKWITISQSYSIQDILLGLLGELDNQENKESNQILAELGEKLYKMLFGRRYLIVMDDVWSTDVWDKLRLFFPNNKNGSRILVTTRLSNVADSLGSHNPYLMDFLDKKKSWKLFCIKAFGKEVCPNPELEEIGKNIVECCKGLPLAIGIIGGLLRKSNMTRDDWEIVAKDVLKSIDDSKDEGDCSNILYLSYKHLPINLKPCFLYMRIFREDELINVDDLTDYWIAEGFVKPKGGKTLEKVAHEYLRDLVDRNLILIHDLNEYTGDIWKCKVHDLLRDLCMKEYEKEFFFRISKVKQTFYTADSTCCLCCYSTCFLCCYRKASTRINLPQVNTITQLQATLVSCFVCDVCNVMCSNHNRLRLVKVAVDDNGREYLKPTRLRHLEISSQHKFESTVLPLLWNLQFLDLVGHKIELPTGIWEMPQFRHLNFQDALYVDRPSTQTGRKDYFNLENLQLFRVPMNFRCAEEILKRIQNVKTLDISYRKHSEEFALLNHPLHTVADLHKLHFLICERVDLEYLSFPNSLKILYLGDGNCPWERITIIGSLPNLEVLFLVSTLGGPEWHPIEGEFLRLKTLVIRDNDLVQWNAEKYHFPRLEFLELEAMKCLEKIPSGIGDVETLREIRVISCTESVVQSAEEIIAEQRDYGNEELQLTTTRVLLISKAGRR